MPVALGLRLWLSGIVIYNLVCGVLAIIDPKVLDALFPGSAALWGLESRAGHNSTRSSTCFQMPFVHRGTKSRYLELTISNLQSWKLTTQPALLVYGVLFFGKVLSE